MTNEQKLKEVIEYAVNQGWKNSWGDDWSITMRGCGRFDIDVFGEIVYRVEEVLFMHSFAKAVFGEEDVCSDCGENEEENYDDGICINCHEGLGHDSNGFGDMEGQKAWKRHLQNCVISDNPLNYYFEYIVARLGV